MPKGETYGSHLQCPNCENIGTAIWSENENRVYGNGLDCQLESVSAGFEPLHSQSVRRRRSGDHLYKV